MDFDAVSSYEPHTMQAETLCDDLHVFGRSFGIVLQIQDFLFAQNPKNSVSSMIFIVRVYVLTILYPNCLPQYCKTMQYTFVDGEVLGVWYGVV